MGLEEIRDTWERLAEEDPYWAILSSNLKRGNRWEVGEFMETGRQDVELWMTHLAEAGAEPPLGRALDFGCGVGRVSRALAERFEEVVGVDVSAKMLELGRRLQPPDNLTFLHNDRDNLRVFPDGSFDLVLSILVLQHLPPEVTLGYLAEFGRVLRPGGILLCEIPAAPSELPPELFRAGIELVEAPTGLVAGRPAEIRVAIQNISGVAWPAPPQELLRLGNHWLKDGVALAWDDGRTPLLPVAPGGRIDVSLTIVPPEAGRLTLELDVVAENIAWFATRGSQTLAVEVDVLPQDSAPPPEPRPGAEPLEPEPELPGHWIDPDQVQQVLRRSGFEIVEIVRRKVPAFEDNYYIARKTDRGRQGGVFSRLRGRFGASA